MTEIIGKALLNPVVPLKLGKKQPRLPCSTQAAESFRPRPDPYRTCNVLEFAIAIVEEGHLDRWQRIVLDPLRNQYAARFGHAFEPRRNIDPLAVDIAVFNDDVAQVNSDTQYNSLFLGRCSLSPDHSLLQLDRATYCLCGAREFSQKSVTGQLEHPPIAACNSRNNELFTQLFKSFERTQFVQFHQAAVSDHVSGKDRGEPALHLLGLQSGGLMQGEIRIFRLSPF